ncbi:5'-nucleotidase domain-containing protein 1 [Chironomus tepperi]|uniref:5'-nucleotidase domain-containing protein 1 n=1 Tax=Chironomus tepperi TaxID=113505 RepID=UPI00391F1C02
MRNSFILVNLVARKIFSCNNIRQSSKSLHIFTQLRAAHKPILNSKIMENTPKTFSLNDYDCIGFDLDNTIVKYNVKEMIYHEYNVLSDFLVEKGYSKEFLKKPIEEGVDFLQKGLILDFERGNLLRICPDGTIQIASHGSRFLSKDEIISFYGEKRRWEVTDEYCRDMLVAWNGTLADSIRTCLDYFDMPAALAFARIIDSIDLEKGGVQEKYKIWPDILAGLMAMFSRDYFPTGGSKYFEALKNNPSKFIYKCDQKVLDWLRLLKNRKKSFLITGSHIDFASLTAGYAIGPNWQEYFDLIICYAKKPGFFTLNRDFLKLDGIVETEPIKVEDMVDGGIYTQGNFTELRKFISSITKLDDPKILYVGDNLIQDVFTPNKHIKIDTVAVIEEMLAEGVDYDEKYDILRSNSWGSYFHTNGEDTLWERIIRKHSKICVPCIDELAKNPIDHKYSTFDPADITSCGYYPHNPFEPIA